MGQVSGFVSGGRSFGAGVVVRVSRAGWAWSFRAARTAPGSWPAPAAVCIPFHSRVLAAGTAQRIAQFVGWRASVRVARRCPGAAFEVKVVLPAGVSVAQARVQLSPALPSWLALLGV